MKTSEDVHERGLYASACAGVEALKVTIRL